MCHCHGVLLSVYLLYNMLTISIFLLLPFVSVHRRFAFAFCFVGFFFSFPRLYFFFYYFFQFHFVWKVKWKMYRSFFFCSFSLHNTHNRKSLSVTQKSATMHNIFLSFHSWFIRANTNEEIVLNFKRVRRLLSLRGGI